MNFNSLKFLIFLPVTVFLYRVCPKRFRWVVLLIASYYSYMSWNAYLVFLIAGTTLVSYSAGLLIGHSESVRLKKLYVIFALVLCLGVLFFFKYFDFLSQSVIDIIKLFGFELNDFSLNLLLPIGISFYTFQTLSYVIDVYRGDIKPEKHLGYYALFVSFFPQLVAGPIERPQYLIPQLKEEHKLSRDDISAGFRFLLSGFFKKCVVADYCGMIVNSVFGDLSSATGLSLVAATAFALIQVYCDFAGYSEIAMGSARLMGIKLTRNFNRPFRAQSISEFWRRWHITLNTWFRDYLYIPLGGSRKGKVRRLLNLMIVFVVSGLWHGASWNFVLWGAFLGLANCAEVLLRKPYGKFCEKFGINSASVVTVWLRRALVFIVFQFSMIFFRGQSFSDVGIIMGKIFTGAGWSTDIFAAALASMNTDLLGIVQLVLSLLCMTQLHYMIYPEDCRRVFFSDSQRQSGATIVQSVTAQKAVALWLTAGIIAVAWIFLLSLNDMNSFIYFQF